jgi:hypothetical protein
VEGGKDRVKKKLLAILIGINAIVLVVQVPLVDILCGLKKGIVMSHLCDLRHQGIIENEKSLEIALGLFGLAKVQRTEDVPNDAEMFDTGDTPKNQDGNDPFHFGEIFAMPGRMARFVSILLLANILAFAWSWRYASKQRQAWAPSSNRRRFLPHVLVALSLILAGIDLLGGVAHLPLANMVASAEHAQARNCFRELQSRGITSSYAFDHEMNIVFGPSGMLLGIAGFVAILLLTNASVHVLCVRMVSGGKKRGEGDRPLLTPYKN